MNDTCRYSVVFCVCLLFLYLPVDPVKSELPWTETNALSAFKAGIRSDPKRVLDTWTNVTDPCTAWYGVQCDKSKRHVAKLYLPQSFIGGVLTPNIGALTHLGHLILTGNRLSGPIPEQLCLLNNLRVVELAGNFLTGGIPANISDLRWLEKLDLSANNLTGKIPGGLGTLNNLTTLRLGSNRLTGSIPPDLFEAAKLHTLQLENNLLSGNFPSTITTAVSLRKFHVHENLLTGSLPAQLGAMFRLGSFLAFDNPLMTGRIPESIGNLRRLRYLYLGNMGLTGDISLSLSRIPHLKELSLKRNNLTGLIPESIGKMQSLGLIELSHNSLEGGIPSGFSNLTSLTELYLQENHLSGGIPVALGGIVNLTQLNLSSNDLNGSIPGNLHRFGRSSFEGNLHLCGFPLLECVTAPVPNPPPPAAIPVPSPHSNNSPSPSPNPGSSRTKTRNIIIGSVVAGFASLSIFVVILFFVARKGSASQLSNRLDPATQSRNGQLQIFARDFRWSFEDLVSNAGFFDTAHILGKGRFATVYRSNLPDGESLAIKVFKFADMPSTFEKEIQKLALLKHTNLLSIKGLYSNPQEKAIVFDLMPNLSLYNALHPRQVAMSPTANIGQNGSRNQEGIDLSPTTYLLHWRSRQRIAFDTAQALLFLHRGNLVGKIIHKDVKSSNILLDNNMVAHLADFGLVGLIPNLDRSIPSVVETVGYTAPEVKTVTKYSEKSDIYSFGVVLMELITGKKPVTIVGDRTITLAHWATRLYTAGRGREIIDPRIAISCPAYILDKALNLAVICLHHNPTQRPTLVEIISILETLSPPASPTLSPSRSISLSPNNDSMEVPFVP